MQTTYCPYCMTQVQGRICPKCGNDINYEGNPVHLQIGTVLTGRHTYILGASLGQGGFGVTYIALDTQTNTRVAIKEYFPTYCSSRNPTATIQPYPGQEDSYLKGRESFLQEARTLQSLSDLQNVVGVVDYFETNNTAYLVMEFVDGCSLKDYVQHNGKFPAKQFLDQMQPLMKDLDTMHRRGMIHRDIAPDNIILQPDGSLKIIDFGAARSYHNEKSMTVVVKKGFAPVEQYMRSGMGTYTDVYALAATIYYCITGKVPADSAERQYGNAALQSPAALGADITPGQEMALARALEIQPFARTQSVADFAKGLQEQTVPVFQTEELDVHQSVSYPYNKNPKGKIVQLSVNGRTVMVQMPDKLENGQILRYEGKGRVSSHTGKVGDLYVTVNIEPAPIPVKLIAAGAAAVLVLVLILVAILPGKSDPPPTGNHEGQTSMGGTIQIPITTNPPATQPPIADPPATEPPATQPPATQPPATEPPATQPPATQPPATEPPATQPPVTEPEKSYAFLADLGVGDTFHYGSYASEKDPTGQKEEIRWKVLDKRGDEILVISDCVVDVKHFNDSGRYEPWSKCSLRSWLNDNFYNAAFSADEQSRIVRNTVWAQSTEGSSQSAGSDTEDKIFILSQNQVHTYFRTKQEQIAYPTESVKRTGVAFINETLGSCWWWVRNPGVKEDRALCVNSGGGVGDALVVPQYSDKLGTVRPAMWLKVK